MDSSRRRVVLGPLGLDPEESRLEDGIWVVQTLTALGLPESVWENARKYLRAGGGMAVYLSGDYPHSVTISYGVAGAKLEAEVPPATLRGDDIRSMLGDPPGAEFGEGYELLAICRQH